jgi:pyridoxal phosphate enzyme (YggS family)
MDVGNNYNQILSNINRISNNIKLIVVSKTFSINHLKPILDLGHTHFGENRVHESIDKWTNLLKENNNLKIHLIGKLQTNKVVEAINHFSFVHSLDNEKLAIKISKEENNLGKKIKYFIQVNIGKEVQKSGISIENSSQFIKFCVNELKINIHGLMCIPPANENPNKFFLKLKEIANFEGLKNLSMGMSNDYLEAINCGANYLRIGSAILGTRSNF